eukprot:scaffold3756_cov60-Phaeocystis_antarctica.AAC.4
MAGLEPVTSSKHRPDGETLTIELLEFPAAPGVWSPCGTRPEYGTRGISHPRNVQVPAGSPQQYDPLLAVRADGGVV